MGTRIDPSYIIMGIKHSGKTTLGTMLAQHLECPFFDTDEIIAINSKKSVRDLYASKGAAQFMLIEEKVCALLASKISGKRSVIATGGGICDNAPALTLLRTLGTFVYIEALEETAISRILCEVKHTASGLTNLPGFIAVKKPKNEVAVRQIFHEFYEYRSRTYRAMADIVVSMEDAAPDVNFNKLLEALAQG